MGIQILILIIVFRLNFKIIDMIVLSLFKYFCNMNVCCFYELILFSNAVTLNIRKFNCMRLYMSIAAISYEDV